tara:strand:+ start:205 stop:1662 length:1458 start_codon:yes stop_codon:yes gene_type:complete
LNENVELKEGVFKINTKNAFTNLYEDIKNKGSESYYNEKIKNFENFKSLRPYFDDSETSKFEEFLAKKKKKNKSKNYNKVNNCYQAKSNDDTFDLDDDVIIDNNFSVLLNEDREIIVEGILYRYQEDGVFQVEEERIDEFRSYLSGGIGQKKSYTDEDFGFQRMDYLTEVYEDCNYGGSGSGGGSPVTEPDFHEAKLNFPTSEFSKNPSLWGETFGYARTEIVSLPDDKRMKLKFWNRNYVLFKSIGTEIRFQKRVCFIVCGWQKSYPDEIAMGINSIEYNYEADSNKFINSSMVFPKLYSFGGYDYFPNGQISYTPAPIIYFPLAKTLGATNGFKLTLTNPFTDLNFKIDISSAAYADLINKAGALLLKEGSKQFPKLLGYTPDEDNTLMVTNVYRNGTSISIHNKNWKEVNDNNITQYLDFEIPTITVTSNIGDTGQSYFSDINIKPSFDEKSYKTGAIDFFGGVLYKNKWYGVRMVSTDFRR